MTTLMPFGRTRQFFLYILLIAVLLTSGHCKKDQVKDKDNNPPAQVEDPLKPANDVRTTVSGVIIGEDGKPVSGVMVSVNGESDITNTAGTFMLSDIEVPGNRCVINAEKEGYFPATRGEIPVKDGITKTRLSIMTSTPTHSISATTGGKATLANGSEVQIPANGVVDESGQPYAGKITMTVRYLDPSKPGFSTVVPGGDMLAQRTDQSTSILYSYGILRVKLTADNGENLQIAAGKTSTITMDIPDKQLATAPASIPLWYFDDEAGIWKEEGTATKQGDKYVGTVKHFTDWNCDSPEDAATIIGKLVDCKGEPAWGHIDFGQIGADESGGTADTDANDGNFRKLVPAGISITLVVYDPLFISPLVPSDQGQGKLIVIVPPLSPGQVYDVGKLQIFPCRTKVSASFKMKAGDQLDYVRFETSTGGIEEMPEPGTSFTLNGFPANTSVTMIAVSKAGIVLSKTFTTAASGGLVNLGEIDMSNFQEAYIIGKLVCNNEPLTQGQVSASWQLSTGNGKIEYGAPGQDGSFRLTVALNQTIELSLSTSKGTITKTITTTSVPGEINIGVIDFCIDNQPSENSYTISGDGFSNFKQLVNLNPYPNSGALYINSDALTQVFIQDMNDAYRFVVTFTGKSTGVAPNDQNTGVVIFRKSGTQNISYHAGYGQQGTNVTITVTRYDVVGKLVEGTFSGTFMGSNGSTVTITNGKFSAVRIQDI